MQINDLPKNKGRIVVFMDLGLILDEGLLDNIFQNPKHESSRHFLSRYQSGIRV